MKISRELALLILRYLKANPDFYFPFEVMCKEVDQNNREEYDEDFIGVYPDDLDEEDNDLPERYQTFELRENLNNLDEETVNLMARGFLRRMWATDYNLMKLKQEYQRAEEQRKAIKKDPDFIGEDRDPYECFEYGYLRGIEKAIGVLSGNETKEWE